MPSSFDAAILEFLRHGKSTLDFLNVSVAEQENLPEAFAFKGLAYLLAARPELKPEINTCLHFCSEHSMSPLSRCLSSALEVGLHAGRQAAADILDAYDPSAPHSILTFKLSHQLRFMAGDHAGMLSSARNYVQQSKGKEFASFANGCYAFALEEAGQFQEAEKLARSAVEGDPKDAWATHVVYHIFDMTNRPNQGLTWSKEAKLHYAHCNNFRFHMEWHEGLFLIRLRHFDSALQHYDNHIRPEQTDDFRDFANAASYLTRLMQHQVPVGTRWDELFEVAKARVADQDLVFASLHRLLAFLAVKDFRRAQEVVSALAAQGGKPSEQGIVANQVGHPLAECLVRLATGNSTALGDLAQLTSKMQMIGGSKVQREIFLDLLRHMLIGLGLPQDAARVVDYRDAIAVREGR